jgi:hypothetical protein
MAMPTKSDWRSAVQAFCCSLGSAVQIKKFVKLIEELEHSLREALINSPRTNSDQHREWQVYHAQS